MINQLIYMVLLWVTYQRQVSHNIRASVYGVFMTMVYGVDVYAFSIPDGDVVDYFTAIFVKEWNSM